VFYDQKTSEKQCLSAINTVYQLKNIVSRYKHCLSSINRVYHFDKLCFR